MSASARRRNRTMRRRRLRNVVAIALMMLPAVPRAAGAPQFAADAVVLLERWNAAVREHKPGMLDPHLKNIAALTYEDRRTLDPAMKLFLSALTGRRYEPVTEPERQAYQLAVTARAEVG